VLTIGICGGFQMLGTRLVDAQGQAGDAGAETGLGLLPAHTRFTATKVLRQVTAQCDCAQWRAYEIHMGQTTATADIEPLHVVSDAAGTRSEGLRLGNVWGTYLHGWFDSPHLRARVTAAAGIVGHRAHPVPWAEQRQNLYRSMAEHLGAHINLDPVKRYLSL
jgi:adenosylcobyric acid synthase